MAYADGELEPSQRSAFELRLAAEPALRREVARFQRLALLARQTSPPEPADHEWAALERELVHRGGRRLGLLLVAVGSAGLGAWGCAALCACGLGLWPKILSIALLAGLLLLFLVALRARLRTLPYDPYSQVKR